MIEQAFETSLKLREQMIIIKKEEKINIKMSVSYVFIH